jgi:hypothetical protein
MIGVFGAGMNYHLIVFDTIAGNLLSPKRFSAAGI